VKLAVVAALGLCLALYLVAYVGFGAVASAAVAVGWGGFALLCLYGLAQFALLGSAWHVLLPAPGARLRIFVWGRMVRDAAADALPFSPLGGMVLGARAASLHGVPAPSAFASTIVDVTTEMLAQLAYIALGLAILITRAPQDRSAASLTKISLIGFVLALGAGGAFLALQRFGHRLTLKLAQRLLPRAVASTAAVGEELDRIYASRPRVAASAAIHLLGWIAGAVGSWIAFRLIGVRIDLASVIAIESLVSAVKSAAVIVPNALGVQEATYAALAPVFGVGAPLGLALSLLKRARDLALAMPILVASHAMEGRQALPRKA
jgi:glycosyltransferase 2 family protein